MQKPDKEKLVRAKVKQVNTHCNKRHCKITPKE